MIISFSSLHLINQVFLRNSSLLSLNEFKAPLFHRPIPSPLFLSLCSPLSNSLISPHCPSSFPLLFLLSHNYPSQSFITLSISLNHSLPIHLYTQHQLVPVSLLLITLKSIYLHRTNRLVDEQGNRLWSRLMDR